ncbi:MAG TPA: FtsX-like permease family protein [Rectinemataceae bacterium]|nr:FtsX-like permease family protein [Rectinemataceae bacterium]
MPVTFRIAFRNLFEHKSKSLIIGILLALGALVLVVGNSFIDASRQGIRTSFTDNYTGDVFVSGLSEEGDVSLFGVMSVGGLASTPMIPDFDKVLAEVRGSPLVNKATGMATSYGIVTRGDEGISDLEGEDSEKDMTARLLFLFGIDARDYWTVFDSIDITSGKALEPGQTGLVINEEQLSLLSKWMNRPLNIGDNLVIQGFSSAGMKIRELPIVATYRQKGGGANPMQMAFVDIDTLRIMAGMTIGTNENIVLDESQTAMLSIDDTDSLFADNLFEATPTEGGFDEGLIQNQLADTEAREKANTADTGAWQFIVIKTKDPAGAKPLIATLNETFAREGIKAQAGDWQKAAGPYGQSVDVIRIVFTVAIAILSIVAIIIIMNTFVISVIERTGEIGTMRAIGAGKGFIRKLFAAEALVLSLIFSTIGALLGLGITAILGALKLEAGNSFLEVLFGGKYLAPTVTPISFFAAILAMVAVGYIAHLYPVSVALKIQPVRAMQQD